MWKTNTLCVHSSGCLTTADEFQLKFLLTVLFDCSRDTIKIKNILELAVIG